MTGYEPLRLYIRSPLHRTGAMQRASENPQKAKFAEFFKGEVHDGVKDLYGPVQNAQDPQQGSPITLGIVFLVYRINEPAVVVYIRNPSAEDQATQDSGYGPDENKPEGSTEVYARRLRWSNQTG